MHLICFTINGKRRCIEIPILVQKPIRVPPPNNFPELELAFTVLELVQAVKPSELSKQLIDVSNRYVEDLKNQLPQGVEINEAKQAAV